MVRNSLKWNLSEEKILQIIHFNIIEILKGHSDTMIDVKDLITLLNEKTSNHIIHHTKKYNIISKYIKINYGGVLKFIDTYNIYGLSEKKSRKYVHLLDKTVLESCHGIGKRITSDNEWIMI